MEDVKHGESLERVPGFYKEKIKLETRETGMRGIFKKIITILNMNKMI